MLAISVIVFWISIGLIESYHFAGRDLGVINNKEFPDYHFWKLVLYLSLLGAVLSPFSWPKLIGGWLLGNFIFERTIDRLVKNIWFDEGGFHLAGRYIPYPIWVQVVIGLVGVVILIVF